ncbi:hypothetical protein SLEP1_g2152 [Rubroshorea leprosula]|uniref:Uncharacterized protein n=1 Tax=Rubroshorea leprosula TaxID=152421 RepID=A0AAV5HGR6_9ROSI|nr:hypothetical protein SLEP1_g2152 [Rubroshorea leprosula]
MWIGAGIWILGKTLEQKQNAVVSVGSVKTRPIGKPTRPKTLATKCRIPGDAPGFNVSASGENGRQLAGDLSVLLIRLSARRNGCCRLVRRGELSRRKFHSLSSRADSRACKLRCRFNHLIRNCSSANPAVVVADDEKYGNKQVISITPRLYGYILANVREPQILRQFREETANMRGSQMQVSPDQAQLLAMLVHILGAERCIEVGVYTLCISLQFDLKMPWLIFVY